MIKVISGYFKHVACVSGFRVNENKLRLIRDNFYLTIHIQINL